MGTDLTGLAGFIELAVQLKAERAVDLATPEEDLRHTLRETFNFGSGAGQVDQIWHDRRTLAGSANETLDFAGGSLKNPFGATITFAKIKAILIHNRSDEQGTPTAGQLDIGNAANPWWGYLGVGSHKLHLEPGCWFVWVFPGDGDEVVGGASDELKIEEMFGVQAEYDIVVVGTST